MEERIIKPCSDCTKMTSFIIDPRKKQGVRESTAWLCSDCLGKRTEQIKSEREDVPAKPERRGRKKKPLNVNLMNDEEE